MKKELAKTYAPAEVDMKNVNIVFDTDAGSDCDDMMALAYLIYGRRHLGVNLLAITHCLSGNYAIPAIRAFFRHYGEPVPAVGKVEDGVKLPDKYCGAVSERFGISEDFAPVNNAVSVLRRTLAECEGKCVICAVGHFTNIAQLIRSDGDDLSPLRGIDLLREKCEKLVVMAAKFRVNDQGILDADWNIRKDVPSAKIMFEECPVPIVALPSETGKYMMTGRELYAKYGDNDPLALSFAKYLTYDHFSISDGRHSWDPATVVYAVEGCRDFLSESERGKVLLTDDGISYFTPDSEGNVTVLTNALIAGETETDSKARMARYIDCCVEQMIYESSK